MEIAQVIIKRTEAEGAIRDIVNKLQRETGIGVLWVSIQGQDDLRTAGGSAAMMVKDLKSVRIDMRLP